MTIKRKLAAMLCAMAATLSVPVLAAPTVYFGEDTGAGGPSNMPNSLAARNQFTGSLGIVGIEDFESFNAGDTFPSAGNLIFTGSSITAITAGGLVSDSPVGNRFAVDGDNFLSSSFNQRITFNAPVAAFGTFVVDANEVNNDPATVTVNEQTLTQEEIEARPFDSVDGIFRIITERSPGVFELLFDGGTFPVADSTAMFVGLFDAVNPYSNIIFINGASGLDSAFSDGFGYDQLIVGFAVQDPSTVPEPSTLGLVLLGMFCAAKRFRRRA